VYTRLKDKITIICKKRDHGEFLQTAANHLQGACCPICSKRRINNRIRMKKATIASDRVLSKEFCIELNGGEKPEDFALYSKCKVWWQCPKGHKYKSIIKDRSGKGSGCPYCSKKLPSSENNLSLRPHIASEIHPTLNAEVDPTKYTLRSSKKLWWLCKNGHSWEGVISNRTSTSRIDGCPFCRVGKQISYLELRLMVELKKFYPNIKPKERSLGCECGLYIPELNLAIEVDGWYYHKDKKLKDIKKTEHILQSGRQLIHLREKPLPFLTSKDLHYLKKDPHLLIIKNLLSKINSLYNTCFSISELDEKEFRSVMCAPEVENSFLKLRPGLLKEWDYDKNGSLKPECISYKSGLKVWWKCPKGHEWEAVLKNRSNGAGCPYCTGKYVTKETSFSNRLPHLIVEWDPILNGVLTPDTVSFGSAKKIFWKCTICGYSWSSTISDRTRTHGCHQCFNKQK
jgi:hypothetical protein